MALTTTINGTEYKTSRSGYIQITTDYYITQDDEKRTRRGLLIHKAGWNVYHNNGDTPTSQHGDDQATAAAAAQDAQIKAAERKSARAVAKAKEEAAAAERAALISEKGPLATPRQVDYIMALISQGRHHEGGFYDGPTTIEDIRTMSKASASAYITSLAGNY